MIARLGIVGFFAFVIGVLGSVQPLIAQQANLPDGWCNQPSDVALEHTYTPSYNPNINYTWVETMGAGEGGIRAVYQPYNQRLILQRTDPRELIQVIEEGVNLSEFEPLLFLNNCRYLVTVQLSMEGRYSVVAHDLDSPAPGRMGTILDAGRNHRNIEPSPEGEYLLVTTLEGLYFWNLSANTITRLTALNRVYGNYGELETYREARWDVPHGLLQLDLITNITVTLRIPSLEIERAEASNRYVTPDLVAQRVEVFTSMYACTPRLQYQTYQSRVVLTNRYTRELVAVLEENVIFDRFDESLWSINCHYVTAIVRDENGQRVALWNVETRARQDYPYTGSWILMGWNNTSDTLSIETESGEVIYSVTH